ncbi:MAG: TetR family transcriptional regulator [Lachnospiraceae bacterium]|nr:TetR family transcriptional regulator [Lachnospiraceae bacterium]
MGNNQDRRVIRTKRELELALIRLLKKKSIHKISIKELAAEADITRATFYNYYRDPYEMIEQMQDKILASIQDIINETTGGDTYGFFIRLFEYLNDENVRAEILSFNSDKGNGYERIGYCIHNNYMLRWGQKFTEAQAANYKYYRYYIVFGCIAVVENWIKNGKVETPEQMARITNSVLPKEKMYLKSEKDLAIQKEELAV